MVVNEKKKKNTICTFTLYNSFNYYNRSYRVRRFEKNSTRLNGFGTVAHTHAHAHTLK